MNADADPITRGDRVRWSVDPRVTGKVVEIQANGRAIVIWDDVKMSSSIWVEQLTRIDEAQQ